MLRGCLIVGGIACLAGAALCAAIGVPAPAVGWLILLGLVLTVGVLYERARYKPIVERKPGPDWQATGERFIDPESGNLVEVYFKPATGERLYVRV